MVNISNAQARSAEFVAAVKAGLPLPTPSVNPASVKQQSTLHRNSGTQGTQGTESNLMGRNDCGFAAGATPDDESDARYAPWVDPEQPLDEYTRVAVNAVSDCKAAGWIPDWQSGVFHVARYLKAHPKASAMGAMQVIRWLDRRRVEWMPDPDADRDEAETEFVRFWDKIRFLPGMSPVEAAYQRAKDKPLNLIAGAVENRPERYAEFISLVAWLAVSIGKAEVALPCARIGDVMGLTKMTISYYRQFAVEDGYLVLVAAHKRPSHGKRGAATVYRFSAELFDSINTLVGVDHEPAKPI